MNDNRLRKYKESAISLKRMVFILIGNEIYFHPLAHMKRERIETFRDSQTTE